MPPCDLPALVDDGHQPSGLGLGVYVCLVLVLAENEPSFRVGPRGQDHTRELVMEVVVLGQNRTRAGQPRGKVASVNESRQSAPSEVGSGGKGGQDSNSNAVYVYILRRRAVYSCTYRLLSLAWDVVCS